MKIMENQNEIGIVYYGFSYLGIGIDFTLVSQVEVSY